MWLADKHNSFPTSLHSLSSRKVLHLSEQFRKTTLETALTSRTPAPRFCQSTLYPFTVPNHAHASTATFLRAIMHTMSSPSSVRQLSFVLSYTLCPCRPQYGIFPSRYYAHYRISSPSSYGNFPSCYHACHILAVLSTTASSFAHFLRAHRFLRSIIKRPFSNGSFKYDGKKLAC